VPYKKGQKWIGQIRKNGKKRIQKRFPTKQEALSWEVEQRKKPASDWKIPTEYSLGEWANEYLKFAEAKFSSGTFVEKTTVFRMFFQQVDPNLPAARLAPGKVLAHLQGQAKERSGHAANKDRKNLVAAWNWGRKYLENFPNLNPCLVERFPEIRTPRYVPPERDFWKVYDVAREQDQTMLLAFLHLAARRGELFRLTWEDVDFGESRVRLWTRKRQDGSYEYDWLPMTDDLFNALLHQRQKSGSEWVFTNPETGGAYQYRLHWMKKLCGRAGVRNFGMHSIRHLTASILARSSVPMVQIQAILRHKSLTTTERYIRRLDSLKPALQLLSSRKKPSIEPSTGVSERAVFRAVG
jgi:integrase